MSDLRSALVTGDRVAGDRVDRQAGFPAPGSALPGAPPALRRELVAADGVRSGESTPSPDGSTRSGAAAADGGAGSSPSVRPDHDALLSSSDHSPIGDPPSGGLLEHAVLLAAALLGAAAGLRWQQRSGRRDG